MQDFLIGGRELGEGLAYAAAFFVGDEGREWVGGTGGAIGFGYRVQRRGAVAGVVRVGQNVARDSPYEGPELLRVFEPSISHGLFGAHQRFLNRLLGGIQIAEGVQRHYLQSGPKVLE